MTGVKAEEAFKKGDLDRAASLCGQALVIDPNDFVALRVLGMIEVRKRRLLEAIQHFRRAVAVSPNDFLSLEWLQGALLESGQFADAVVIGERAHSIRPRDVNVLIGLSQGSVRTGEFLLAIRHLQEASSLNPANARIHHLLGLAYEKAKRNREALAEYREAIALQPSLTEACDRANRLLLEAGEFLRALELAEQALAAVPTHGAAHHQAAQALGALGRIDEAIARARSACKTDPTLAATVANWLQSYGRSTEARDVLERSIAERPAQGRAYYALIRSRKTSEADRPLLENLESLSGVNLPPLEHLAVLRALGKAHDDLGEFEAAMRRVDEAAALARRIFVNDGAFDRRKLDAARESLFRLIDRGFLERYAHLGKPGAKPIFVIGMIRSGTTLVQQILTSHPDVGDAGEQPYWTTVYPSLVDLDRSLLREREFAEARDEYLEVLLRFDSMSPYVANKWPMNYAFAPLLRLAYPDARIIHISRNPIDTALSIYMSDLGSPPPEYSTRKIKIVAVYRDYQARMSRWEQAIPGGMFHLRYEDLVADQELWTRRLIEYCGLPWDNRCLYFHLGERRVNTPSMVQVRQPIYSSSVDRWRLYEPWLGEFDQLKP